MGGTSSGDETPRSVLTDPLFLTDPPVGGGPVSLVDLLAHLLAGNAPVVGFPRLAAEQRGHWHRFLVRCAGKALRTLDIDADEASARAPTDLATRIDEALTEAAGGSDAWNLWGNEPSRPAFLQPPTPEGEAPSETYRRESLSFLTCALGAKNHERKVDTRRRLAPEETAYALIAFQSGVIYGGRYNYESQIMGSSSGAGSGTPFMGAQISRDLRNTFRHDVDVLLGTWDQIRDDRGLRGSTWALWIEPWDGTSSLPASDLDPAFIPMARFVRLAAPQKGYFRAVWFKTSKSKRVEDHSGGGNLGDVFTPRVPHPRKADEWKVRGTLEKGYDYKEIVRLLGFGEDGRPSPSVRALQESRFNERPDLRVLFEGIAFERGKTVGFHRREILLPTSFVRRRPWDDPDPARKAHRTMLTTVGDAKSALRGTARFLLAGSPRPREGDQGKIDAPARLLEERVDRIYLDQLFEAAELEKDGDESYRTAWGEKIADMALAAFRDAKDEVPSVSSRSYEREVRAESWLRGRLRELRAPEGEPQGETAA